MIARLRRRHRVMIAGISPIILLLTLAIQARPYVPDTVLMPEILAAETLAAPTVLWERDDLWSGLPIVTRWRGEGGVPIAVELQLDASLRRPEVLLYWSPSLGTDPEALPGESHLLGGVGGLGTYRLALPADARAGRGHLLLYSLGHDGVFASATLPDAAAEAGRR